MERGGQTVQAIGAAIFVWGFVADATGAGAPAGIVSQGSAGLGGALGYFDGKSGDSGQSARLVQLGRGHNQMDTGWKNSLKEGKECWPSSF